MKWIKRIWFILFAGMAVLLGVILICNRVVAGAAEGLVYDDISAVPLNRAGLLLGTSPRLRTGKPNLYFNYRIDAAVRLYRTGRICRIIVSGDNRKRNYNEPLEMQKALLARGVPDSVIVMDYAGLRTLDSVVRSKMVFGQDSITVISQRFHNERALYIARHHGIRAVGFNAQDVSAYNGFRTNARELLARVKVFIDILIGKGPRHIGDPVKI